MPVGAAVIITTFLVWERKARRAGLIPHKKLEWSKTHEAVWNFMSAIDLGGIVLLCGGCSSVLSQLRRRCISRLTILVIQLHLGLVLACGHFGPRLGEPWYAREPIPVRERVVPDPQCAAQPSSLL